MALRTIPSGIKPAKQSRGTPLKSEGGVARSIYRSPEWVAFREAIVSERGRRCEKCLAIGPVVADHIVEIRDGGEIYARRNIQLLCLPCHNTKTAEARRTRNETR